MLLVNFVCPDHFRYQVVEYGILALGTVYTKAELVEIPVDVKVAYPRVGRPYPRLNLVYHGVQGLEVRPLGTFYLGDVMNNKRCKEEAWKTWRVAVMFNHIWSRIFESIVNN